MQSLRTEERKTLLTGGSDARYVATGHLVYALGGVVLAAPFDPRSLALTGGAVPVVEGVRRSQQGVTGAAQFAIAHSGALIYVPGPVSMTLAQSDLALIDRNGSVQPLKLPPGFYLHPRVSPDGRHIAVTNDSGKEADVWIHDLERPGVDAAAYRRRQEPFPYLVGRQCARGVPIGSRRRPRRFLAASGRFRKRASD